MKVGSEIGIVGEGDDISTVSGIHKREDGTVFDVSNSSGWREPLCKMYLLRGRYHNEARKDPTSWIQVAVGECDMCGVKFPDSCIYHGGGKGSDVMICNMCYKDKGEEITDLAIEQSVDREMGGDGGCVKDIPWPGYIQRNCPKCKHWWLDRTKRGCLLDNLRATNTTAMLGSNRAFGPCDDFEPCTPKQVKEE